MGENDAWIAATAALGKLKIVGDDNNAFADRPAAAYSNFRTGEPSDRRHGCPPCLERERATIANRISDERPGQAVTTSRSPSHFCTSLCAPASSLLAT